MGEGCSDDFFDYFRFWLISLGRETFERALSDPDSLADIVLGPAGEDDMFFEEYGYIAPAVFESLTGSELEAPDQPGPSAPAGTQWSEDGLDLPSRFPRLWAKYSAG